MRLFAACWFLWLEATAAQAPWGGELRIALNSEPRTFDPALASDEASEVVRYLTGGVLVRVNRVSQLPEPALASSWEVLDSGRAIRFRLREGVSFSDGTPFTADDVVYTMERLMDPALHSPVGDSFRLGAGPVRALAEGTASVVLRFPAPLAGGVRLFDQVCVVPRRPRLPSGAVLGPFTVAEHRPGAYLRLARNPHYWRTSAGRRLPYLDSIRIDIQQNRDLQFLRFQRGELHLMSGLDPDQFEDMTRTRPGQAKDAGTSLDNDFLWFNLARSGPVPAWKKAWFRSRPFRVAVSHAIRREDLCRVVYKGRAAPGTGPFPPVNAYWYNRQLQPHVFDPALARKLLAEDGFRSEGGLLRDRDGHPVEFSLITNAGNKPRERMASLIQQDLAAVGIRLNVVTLDFASLVERITKTLDYEACLLGFNNVDLDPAGQMNLWLSSSTHHAWNPRQSSPETAWEAEIDRLMKVQASSADGKTRKAAFDRVQELALEQAPILYLVNRHALVGVSPLLRDVRPAVLHPRVLWNADEIRLEAR